MYYLKAYALLGATVVSAAGLTGAAKAFTITPVYQVSGNDYTWTETANQGEYTVPTISEDYANEIWERPVKDNEWSDAGGTRTSEKLYYAYADLKSADWGVGTSDGTDYLFVRWEVVGAFQHEIGKSLESKLLESHYYFYAEPAGMKAFAIEVPSGKDLGSDFGDASGKVNIYEEVQEGDVPRTAITTTQEGGSSFGNSQVKGDGRTNTSTFITEVAVKLSDLGLVLSDFDTDLDYAYTGVAVSNPSSSNTDLFANDHFPVTIGSGVEYDTLRMGTSVPEPASLALLSLGGLVLIRRQ
jgi:PEP-CTERM motif-containing protein